MIELSKSFQVLSKHTAFIGVKKNSKKSTEEMIKCEILNEETE